MNTQPNNQTARTEPESVQFMAIDQYGETFHALGKHPRSELLHRLGRRHASKMFVDNFGTKSDQSVIPPKDVKTFHVGYVIAGRWLTLYQVKPMRKAE